MILPPGLTRLTWNDYFSKKILAIIEQTECLRMSLRRSLIGLRFTIRSLLSNQTT